MRWTRLAGCWTRRRCSVLYGWMYGARPTSEYPMQGLAEYEEQNGQHRWSTGYSCLIRVSLKDGTFHDDVGFGSVQNERDRGKAIENARKEAVSDGVKRGACN